MRLLVIVEVCNYNNNSYWFKSSEYATGYSGKLDRYSVVLPGSKKIGCLRSEEKSVGFKISIEIQNGNIKVSSSWLYPCDYMLAMEHRDRISE